MNGRFIDVDNFQKWLTMLTDLKRVHAAQDKIEQSEICFLCVSLTIVSFKRFILSLVPDFLSFPYYREEIRCGNQGVFLYDFH